MICDNSKHQRSDKSELRSVIEFCAVLCQQTDNIHVTFVGGVIIEFVRSSLRR